MLLLRMAYRERDATVSLERDVGTTIQLRRLSADWHRKQYGEFTPTLCLYCPSRCQPSSVLVNFLACFFDIWIGTTLTRL